MATPLWFVSDMAGEHLLTVDWQFMPVNRAKADGLLLDDDGQLWAFHSEREATAFCAGHRISGGFVRPWGQE